MALSAKKREKKLKKVEFFCLWQGLEGLAQDSSERAIDFFLYRTKSFLLLFLKCYYKINLSYKKRTQFE
ncbi:MAG: hypothetical protein PUE59_02015 [Treponema sp.]|nr:hypothetical protein [Treponema sp.]